MENPLAPTTERAKQPKVRRGTCLPVMVGWLAPGWDIKFRGNRVRESRMVQVRMARMLGAVRVDKPKEKFGRNTLECLQNWDLCLNRVSV